MASASTYLGIIHLLLLVVLVKCSVILPAAETVPEVARYKSLIEGYVYCKYNNMYTAGQETLQQAHVTPLVGAGVSLNCTLNEKFMVESSKTKDKGYFSILSSKPMSYIELIQQCKVYLSSTSPDKKCSFQTDLNGGQSGAVLQFKQHQLISELGKTPLLLQKYTVGPFAFHSSATPMKIQNRKSKDDENPCDPSCLSCVEGCCHCKSTEVVCVCKDD